IAANGGFAIERFRAPAACGGHDCMRYRWYTGVALPIERETERLTLRQWRDADRGAFADMNADPVVMEHFPATWPRGQSDAMLERVRDAIVRRGWGMWAVERRADASLLGFVGLTTVPDDMPFAPAVEVGWRLVRPAWGFGYATEAAREALHVAFDVLGLAEVVSYTALTNERSAAVMRRLGMREAGRFDHPRVPEGHRLRPHRLLALRREDFARLAVYRRRLRAREPLRGAPGQPCIHDAAADHDEMEQGGARARRRRRARGRRGRARAAYAGRSRAPREGGARAR